MELGLPKIVAMETFFRKRSLFINIKIKVVILLLPIRNPSNMGWRTAQHPTRDHSESSINIIDYLLLL